MCSFVQQNSSLFLSLPSICFEVISHPVNYRGDGFSRPRESRKIFKISPTGISSHELRMLIGFTVFRRFCDVSPFSTSTSPSMHIRCTSFDYVSRASCSVLSRIKLTSAIQLSSWRPPASGQIPPRTNRFYSALIRYERRRRAVELLFDLVSTGWKRLSHKESDAISYDGSSDADRNVYSCNHSPCILILI